ncbi:MAG: type VI secretion system tube protein Hcp [Planctomycetota bacterium]
MNAFLDIPGVKGSARQEHVKDQITVHGVVAEVRADLDWKTGRPVPDKSKHQPLVVTKGIDLASPALHAALKLGTTFDHVVLRFWRMPPGGGREEAYYTIRISEVKVVGIQLDMDNNRRPENELLPELEHVSFSYTGISYTFAAGQRQEGTDKKENAESGAMLADCEIPVLAKVKAMAIDAGKDAGKAIAGAIYEALKGGGEAPK